MAANQAQLQRFELKYLIREQTARAVRSFVRCYLQPDDFAANRSNYSYPVHTLYLDSPDLSLYHATNNGDRNRYKLRIRFYDNSPDAPVYFEIKRRDNECISKQRARVRRDAVHALLTGEWPEMRHLAAPSHKHLFALQEFCRLMRRLQATPRSHVAYQREAWMSPGSNAVRVTFDRQVHCEPQFDTILDARLGDSVHAFEDHVILELKFTSRMPQWCGELVRSFGLVRGSAAKYAEGVCLMGEHRVSNRGVGFVVPATATADAVGSLALVAAQPVRAA
jgi:SPX domain protein involved in polyphosphate accumulation